MLFDFLKKYEIAWLKTANKQLEKLPKKDRSNIIAHIDDINNNPEALDFKKLSGFKDLYRLRVGNYRVILTINKIKKMTIISYVGNRKAIYDSIKRLSKISTYQ